MKLSWKGCLIGCLSVIAIFILCGIFTVMWLNKKGDFEASTTILTDNTEMYGHTYLRPEDEVLVSFFTSQLNNMAKMNPGMDQMPEFYRNFTQKKTKKDVLKMLPLEVELTAMSSEDSFNAAVGFSLYSNVARVVWWFARREAKDQGTLINYGNHKYIAVTGNDNFYITLIDSIVYFSKTEEGIQGMLDNKDTTLDMATDPRFEGIDTTSPVHGFLVGEAARNGWWNELNLDDLNVEIENGRINVDGGEYIDHEQPADETPAASVDMDPFYQLLSRVAFDLKTENSDTLSGHIVFDVTEKQETFRELLESKFDQINSDIELNLTYTVEEREQGYLINYTISGFSEILERLEH